MYDDKKHKYRYRIKDKDGFGDTVDFNSMWCVDCPDSEYIAEDAAEDIFETFDGYRDSDEWPITVLVESESGARIGEFRLEMEYRPEFYASEVKNDGK